MLMGIRQTSYGIDVLDFNLNGYASNDGYNVIRKITPNSYLFNKGGLNRGFLPFNLRVGTQGIKKGVLMELSHRGKVNNNKYQPSLNKGERMKYSITIVLSFLISLGHSKVMYADKGEDYQGLNLLYDADKETDGESSSLHLEYNIVTYNTEYSLSYTRGQFKDNVDSYFDSSVNGYGVTGAYHIRYPLISIALEAGGTLSFMNAQYLDDLDLEMDGHGYNIGIGLYRTLIKTAKYELIPFVSRTIISSTYVIKDPLYRTIDEYKDSAFKAGLGIKIESPWCSSNYITIQPELIKIGDYSNFSMSIGTLINMVDKCY